MNNYIDRIFLSLERQSRMLQILGIYLILFSVINIAILFLSLIRYIWILPVYAVALLFFTILSGVAFDVIKKNGNATFEELSDFLHGNDKYENSMKKRDFIPKTEARIIMRKYTSHQDLPLLPGKYGPTFLIVFNIIIIFLYIQLGR